MKVTIKPESIKANQSSRSQINKKWHIVSVGKEAPIFNHMGWCGNKKNKNSIQLQFASKELAIAYAKQQNYEYELYSDATNPLKIKSYAENFSTNKVMK